MVKDSVKRWWAILVFVFNAFSPDSIAWLSEFWNVKSLLLEAVACSGVMANLSALSDVTATVRCSMRAQIPPHVIFPTCFVMLMTFSRLPSIFVVR